MKGPELTVFAGSSPWRLLCLAVPPQRPGDLELPKSRLDASSSPKQDNKNKNNDTTQKDNNNSNNNSNDFKE